MKALQLSCPQRTLYLSGSMYNWNKGKKKKKSHIQHPHCHLLVDSEIALCLPHGLPVCYSNSVPSGIVEPQTQMAMLGKGTICILEMLCRRRSPLKPRAKSRWPVWEQGPPPCCPSTSMTSLLKLLCGRNNVSVRITDPSVSFSAFIYNGLFRKILKCNQSPRQC